MSYTKWIGGALGFAAGGILGALAGYAIGAFVDVIVSNDTTAKAKSDDEATRNGFLFSLMVLASHVIRADGKVMHSEMELARTVIRNTFGEQAVTEGNNILLRLFEYRKQQGESEWNNQIRQVCVQISSSLGEEQRIQLLGLLAEFVKADGKIVQSEIQALYEIADGLRLPRSVVDQQFALGGSTLDDAYAVFGLTPQATDDEVRRAYKKLMVQYHPDRVANLGDDIKKAATLKSQEINKAKEIIYKARGM